MSLERGNRTFPSRNVAENALTRCCYEVQFGYAGNCDCNCCVRPTPVSSESGSGWPWLCARVESSVSSARTMSNYVFWISATLFPLRNNFGENTTGSTAV